MKKWKPITGVILVFVLGVLTGTAGTGWFVKQRYFKFLKDPAHRKATVMKRLTERLDLSGPQKAQVEQIFDRLDGRMREKLQNLHSEARNILEEGFAEIRKVLNEDQQQKLAELKKEMEARREKRHRRWLGDHPPPLPAPGN